MLTPADAFAPANSVAALDLRQHRPATKEQPRNQGGRRAPPFPGRSLRDPRTPAFAPLRSAEAGDQGTGNNPIPVTWKGATMVVTRSHNAAGAGYLSNCAPAYTTPRPGAHPARRTAAIESRAETPSSELPETRGRRQMPG